MPAHSERGTTVTEDNLAQSHPHTHRRRHRLPRRHVPALFQRLNAEIDLAWRADNRRLLDALLELKLALARARTAWPCWAAEEPADDHAAP